MVFNLSGLTTDQAGKMYYKGYELATRAHNFGEMYIYNNTNEYVIDAQNSWHTSRNLIAGRVNGFTFESSITKDILSVSDGGDGTIIITTDGVHGIVAGNIVTLTGTTGYDGVYPVLTTPLGNTFTVTKAFGASSVGTATKGSCLIAGDDSDGIYKVPYEISGKGAGTNQEFEYVIFKNAVLQEGLSASCKYGIGGDIIPASGGNKTIDIVAGDIISSMVRNVSGTGNFTVKHMNLTIELK
jgi:hypothetical protein